MGAIVLKLKVKHLDPIIRWLDRPYKGSERRKRNRFLRLIENAAKDFNAEAEELFNDYVVRDENDKKVETSPGRFKLSDADEYKEKLDAIFDEEVVIDLTENQMDFEFVRSVLADIDENQAMQLRDGILFDEIIDAFARVVIETDPKI